MDLSLILGSIHSGVPYAEGEISRAPPPAAQGHLALYGVLDAVTQVVLYAALQQHIQQTDG